MDEQQLSDLIHRNRSSCCLVVIAGWKPAKVSSLSMITKKNFLRLHGAGVSKRWHHHLNCRKYPALLDWRRTTTEAIPRIRSRSYPTRQFFQKFLERLPGVDAPALEALAAGASAWWNLVLGCTGGTGETSKDRRTTPSVSTGCSWGKAYNSWEQPDSELLRNQQRVAHHTT